MDRQYAEFIKFLLKNICVSDFGASSYDLETEPAAVASDDRAGAEDDITVVKDGGLARGHGPLGF